MYELAIIGGGPAGVSAAVYAARKKLKTVFITESFGGQSYDSTDIQNWIGTPHISGSAFGESLEKHLREYAGEYVDLKIGKRADSIKRAIGLIETEALRTERPEERSDEGFEISVGEQKFNSKTILFTTGSTRRKLEIPGASLFENKGIVYCASCDGPLFSGKNVVVIGGGNAGFETSAQLLAYCPSVTLIQRSDRLKADEMTVESVSKNPNFKVILNAEPVEVKGDKPASTRDGSSTRGGFVSSLVYKDVKTNEITEVPTEGIFVEIGLIPNTKLLEGLVEMNEYKQIRIDHRTQKTSLKGVWSAGDNTDVLHHQNNIAAGDAVKALEDIYMYLRAGGNKI